VSGILSLRTFLETSIPSEIEVFSRLKKKAWIEVREKDRGRTDHIIPCSRGM